MARLFNREWSRRDLLARVGDVSQVGGTRRVRLVEGPEDGVEAIEFRTGTGFAFTVLPSRGMDISFAEYHGVPLCWRSATGDVHPAYYESQENGWLRGFYGGLLATCGLTQAGAPSVDEGVALPLHGRANYLPARNVYHDGEWDGDDYIMWAHGRTREATVYGENVRLTRRIWARLGESRLYINDVVENLGHERVPHMIAYHINPGFPVIDAGTRLISTTYQYRPRDADSQEEMEYYYEFHSPKANYKQKVYYHDVRADDDGYAYCASINHGFENGGLGLYVRYMPSQLPYLWEWKQMGEGTYVVGMEPANCLPEGRDRERARGGLRFLEPHESQEYTVEIGVLAGSGDISEYEERVRAVLYVPPPTPPPAETPESPAAEPAPPENSIAPPEVNAAVLAGTADDTATPLAANDATAGEASGESTGATADAAGMDESGLGAATAAGDQSPSGPTADDVPKPRRAGTRRRRPRADDPPAPAPPEA